MIEHVEPPESWKQGYMEGRADCNVVVEALEFFVTISRDPNAMVRWFDDCVEQAEAALAHVRGEGDE